MTTALAPNKTYSFSLVIQSQ